MTNWQQFFEDNAQFLDEIGPKYIVVLMRPADFLALAETGFDEEKTKGVEKLVSEKKRFSSIPFLQVEQHKGLFQVFGHEGRHRARSMIKAGVPLIPVLLRAYNFKWKAGESVRLYNQNTVVVDGKIYGASLDIELVEIRT